MFASMNIKGVRALAEENGITLEMAKEKAGGRPVKSTWVELLEEKGVVVDGAFEPSEESTSPAKLVREGLLAKASDSSIRQALAIHFPDYGAANIACSVYRRELKKKGELK